VSFLRTFRFRILYFICWISWVLFHAFVLVKFGFTPKLALIDSGVSNLLLGGAGILVVVTLQFYFPRKNKYGYILALCTVLAALWLGISRLLLLRWINDVNGYAQFLDQSLLIRFAFGFLLIGAMCLFSVLWYTLQEQQEIELREEETLRFAREAELYKLRQQLQPHFLFNSLNSINALIGTEPKQARTMIQQLSDFLRGTLKKQQNQWVSLNEELQHLQLYLEIEKVRFGHRLSTDIKVEGDGDALQLPSMILQPVVENAIKYGLYDTTGSITISIRAHKRDNNLVLEVVNPYDPETSGTKGGTNFGLTYIYKRLHLLYARSDLLKTRTENNLYITTITVPQQL
jgi:two-component system, LytTR family, sensor kinase